MEMDGAAAVAVGGGPVVAAIGPGGGRHRVMGGGGGRCGVRRAGEGMTDDGDAAAIIRGNQMLVVLDKLEFKS